MNENPPFHHGSVHPDNDPQDDQPDPNWQVPEGGYLPENDPENKPPPGAMGDPDIVANDSFATPMDRAHQIADACLHVAQANYVNLETEQGTRKKYLKLEAWQAFAFCDEAKPGIVSVKDTMLGGISGIIARAKLTDAKGKTLAEADGFVGQDEAYWNAQSVQARVNMAQSRAVGRVCRLVYAFIIKIMNQEHGTDFEVTPADEMIRGQIVASVMEKINQPQAQSFPPEGTRRVLEFADIAGFTNPIQQQNPVQQQNRPYGGSRAVKNQPVKRVGEIGQTETREVLIQGLEIKYSQSGNPFYVVHFGDGASASTFNKKLASSLQSFVGNQITVQLAPRTDRANAWNIVGIVQ